MHCPWLNKWYILLDQRVILIGCGHQMCIFDLFAYMLWLANKNGNYPEFCLDYTDKLGILVVSGSGGGYSYYPSVCHIISYHIISYHIISYHIISYHIISNFIPISYIKTNRHKKHNMILRTWSKGHKGLRKIMPLTKVSTKIYRNLQNNALYK